MSPKLYEPGTIIESSFTNRVFVILEWDDGWYKARPREAVDPNDIKYIREDAVHAYWMIIGKEDV